MEQDIARHARLPDRICHLLDACVLLMDRATLVASGERGEGDDDSNSSH
jgi:hypothetical protein